MNQTLPHREIALDRPGTLVRLWIDGVGCWIVWPGQRLTLGGPIESGASQPPADLCLLANLRRRHAAIEREGESYRLKTDDGAINGRPMRGDGFLWDGDLITLGRQVQMRFRQPSALSASGVLMPIEHSWPRMFTGENTPGCVDGIVLMEEVCLMGPGADAHVACSDWEGTVVLHRRDGQLWCRASGLVQMDGRTHTGAALLDDGTVVSGAGWRFRAERCEMRNRGSEAS